MESTPESLAMSRQATDMLDKTKTTMDRPDLFEPWPSDYQIEANHSFQAYFFKSPHYCVVCHQVAIGQGQRCESCNWNCHSACKLSDVPCTAAVMYTPHQRYVHFKYKFGIRNMFLIWKKAECGKALPAEVVKRICSFCFQI